MKINSVSPDHLIFTSNTQVQQGVIAPEEQDILDMPKVQVILENQIKVLLGEMTKLLNHQATTLQELPSAVSAEAAKILQQSLISDEVVPQGLTAIYKGQKVVIQNLIAMANSMDDAAFLSQNLPGKLPESISKALINFQDLAARSGTDIGKNIMLLAHKLVDNPNPVINAPDILAQTARSLIDSTPREELTIARQEIMQKLPGLLNSLIDDFSQELTQLTTEQGRQILSTSLRENSQQLLETIKNSDRPYYGLPSLLDDLIALFENNLNNVSPLLEKDVMIGNLRQLSQQLFQDILPEDQPVLNRMIDKMQERVPESVKLAAQQHNMPELAQNWVIQKIATGRSWLSMPGEAMQEASQKLREMAVAIQRTTEMPAEAAKAQNAFNLLVPLYLGEEKKPYPAYIHVYQDKERKSAKGEGFVPETWFRLCLSTENIGIVDMIFHIFGKNQLSIRVNFSDIIIAEQFKNNVENIWSKIEETQLTISDISVNAV